VAASTRKVRGAARIGVGAGALLLHAALSCGAGVLPKITQQPIDVTAQSQEADRKNKTISLRKVRIAQGNMTLTADSGQVNGTGVETAFDNSVWIFKGSVKLTL
jgi:lipopolysaccharide export system protein LptA